MIKLLAVVFSFLLYPFVTPDTITTKVQFEWNYINFTWPNQETYNSAIHDKSYIIENNSISGIKIWRNRAYLTIPRWKTGIPATLVSTLITSEISPLLEPYPSWRMQRLGDCSALQFVLSMEIDPLGRMWLLDDGRTEILTSTPKVTCPPRLVIIDLEKEGQVVKDYVFPKEVAHPDSVFLNDIVLDHEDGGIAYITDTDHKDPGIIVFSFRNMTSWKIRDESMKPKAEAFELVVNGTRLMNKSSVNGIALSPVSVENRLVYYTSVSSYEIFTISTSILKSQNVTNRNYSDYVESLGKKLSQSDGIGMSADGVLYFGLLANDAIGMWDIKEYPFIKNQKILVQDHKKMQWPNSFAFDDVGRLWFITNKTHKLRTNSMSANDTNYRIINTNVSSRNYQYFPNGSFPLTIKQ